MERGGRLFVFFLFVLFIVLASAPAADASIELHIDGREVASRPALALLGAGLGIASPVLQEEFGVRVDDTDFPVVVLRYGGRHAVLVVDDGRAVVDGRRAELQVPPRVIDGVLFVPLKLVADLVDLRMRWDIVSGTLSLEHRHPERAGAAWASTEEKDDARGPTDRGVAGAIVADGASGASSTAGAEFASAAGGEAFATDADTGGTPSVRPGVAGEADGDTPAIDGDLGVSETNAADTHTAAPDAADLAAASDDIALGDGPDGARTAHFIGTGEPGEEAGPATLWTKGKPAVLQRVGIEVVDSRVRLEVEADRSVEPSLMFLPLPDRLVVDVPGAVLGAGWRTMPGDGNIVEQVRVSATEDGGVRLVADLTGPTGYALEKPERGEGFVVVMNHQLDVVSAESTANGGLSLGMSATGPLRYRVFPLREPNRIVIDLAGASVPGARELSLEEPFPSSLRVSQYEQDVVRAVIELPGTASASLFAARFAGGVEGVAEPGADGTFSLVLHPLTGATVRREEPEPRPLAAVRSVAVFQQDGTEFVLVEGDAPLAPVVRRFRDPERLVLDLPGFGLDRSLGLTAELPEGSVIGTVRAGQAEPSVSRIVVETAGIAEHHLLLSPDGLRMVLALRRSRLGGRTIVVDPGHGGRDPGAIGHSGTFEKDVTLAIGVKTAQLLEQVGATVIMTRHEDVFVELANRSALANAVGADAFVSIHADAVGFGRIAAGTSTFYFPEPESSPETSVNLRYARSLQQELLNTLGLRDRGVHQRAFHVVRNTNMPSALVEVGFIDNPDEEKLLVDPEFQARAAAAIVDGILRFFAERDEAAARAARLEWQQTAERVVLGFLQSGEMPGDAVALVPMAVLSALRE